MNINKNCLSCKCAEYCDILKKLLESKSGYYKIDDCDNWEPRVQFINQIVDDMAEKQKKDNFKKFENSINNEQKFSSNMVEVIETLLMLCCIAVPLLVILFLFKEGII